MYLCKRFINKNRSNMNIETVNIANANIIPSKTIHDGIRMRQSGMAKVRWRTFDKNVPESSVILGGVDIFKD